MWEQQVGERIRQIRKERNLTRSEFGKLIGLPERYVGKLERGLHSITGAKIATICDKTGVSSDYIIFGSVDAVAAIAELKGLTHEQAKIVLDIAVNVIKFLNTETGNNVLIQEVLRQYNTKNTSI